MGRRETEVVDAFIALTESIANSRANVLDFGEGMVFHRGEIHVVKMVGDRPGLYSSEIARLFGIGRAAVRKTLLKLEERGLIVREQDPSNKKIHRLFLTEKGERAYKCHEEYHDRHDKALFDCVAGMSEDQLEAVRDFLGHALDLIRNHA